MRPGWSKAFRDIAAHRGRSLLAVLGISIGICGFGSVLSTYAILSRELNAGYLATHPASATLRLDRIDASVLDMVRRFPGISDAEERRAVKARIRDGNGPWRNAVLFVIRDYSNIRISRLVRESGSWPPGAGEILIERDAVGVARAKIGDELSVRMPDGAESNLKLTGTVHDVGQAQARMEQVVYGYITASTMPQLGLKPEFDQLKILVDGNQFDESHVRNVSTALKDRLQAAGVKVFQMDVPKPGKHPHADLMGAMLLFQSSFGFFALLLSGLLVANLLSAMMAGQIRQIGIMKAIGATSAQVRRLYLLTVLLLGAAAVAVSLPVTIAAGIALSRFLSRFLNFDLVSVAIPAWVFALEITAGLLVPLLASLVPIRRGARITVLEAVSDYGIRVAGFGGGIADRVLVRISGVARPLLLSLRNAFRQRGRVALTLASLATGGAIFMAALNVRASFIHTIDLMFQSTKYDLAITLAETYPAEPVLEAVRSVPGVDSAESWASGEAALLDQGGAESGHSFGLVGAARGTRMLALRIVQGRDLRPGDTDALVINNRLAQMVPEIQVGKTVKLKIAGSTSEWRIVGLARQAFAGPAAYGDFDAISRALHQVDSTRSVRVVSSKRDSSSVAALAGALEKNLEKAGYHMSGSSSMSDSRKVMDEHNSIIYLFLLIMSFLILAVGGVGLMTLMSISVLERRREIGVMRTLGASRRAILAIVMAEGSILAGISWAIAVIPGQLISRSLGDFVAGMVLRTNLDPAVNAGGILVWLAITLLFGAAASAVPAWNAAGMTVRHAIDYE